MGGGLVCSDKTLHATVPFEVYAPFRHAYQSFILRPLQLPTEYARTTAVSWSRCFNHTHHYAPCDVGFEPMTCVSLQNTP